jgi:release factor glutamine methyltransferase
MTQQQEQPWTVLRLLEWTTDFFKKRGSPSARLDAEVLLAHARECTRIALYTSFAEVPTEEQRVAFREMVRRRGEGMPVAQLVGYREFYSLRFRVDDKVLIPRPETEHLVTAALDITKALPESERPIRVADVGTGSGVIAVVIAKHSPHCEITAIDRSREALEIARWNIEHHEVGSRIRVVESDLFEELPADQTFHLICSNPPYVSEAEYENLTPTVREYEPKEALVAGKNGTETIERLIDQCASRIRPGGHVLIELSPMIADACAEIAKSSGNWTGIEFIKDFANHRRVMSLTAVTK